MVSSATLYHAMVRKAQITSPFSCGTRTSDPIFESSVAMGMSARSGHRCLAWLVDGQRWPSETQRQNNESWEE